MQSVKIRWMRLDNQMERMTSPTVFWLLLLVTCLTIAVGSFVAEARKDSHGRRGRLRQSRELNLDVERPEVQAIGDQLMKMARKKGLIGPYGEPVRTVSAIEDRNMTNGVYVIALAAPSQPKKGVVSQQDACLWNIASDIILTICSLIISHQFRIIITVMVQALFPLALQTLRKFMKDPSASQWATRRSIPGNLHEDPSPPILISWR